MKSLIAYFENIKRIAEPLIEGQFILLPNEKEEKKTHNDR